MAHLPTVFMLAGQGSQYFGMGRGLYQENSFFRYHLDKLDEIAAGVIGKPVLGTIFDPAKRIFDPFDDPTISGISIFVIECALSRTLSEYGVEPDYILGSSLGMYTACVLAQSMSDEQAIEVIYRQGHIFNETCGKGCMINILDSVDLYHSSPLLNDVAEIASINFDSSFAISLPENNLNEVVSYLKRRDKTYQLVPVSRAYHSRWVDGAREGVKALLQSVNFRQPDIPLICCSSTYELDYLDASALWHSVRGRLLFQQTIGNMEERNAHRYIDLSPSGTLNTFLKYVLPVSSNSTATTILSPFFRNTSQFEAIAGSARSESPHFCRY